MPQDKQSLFACSVSVTGTHASMGTLMGQIIGQAPEFNVIHEPLNPKPNLGDNAIGATQPPRSAPATRGRWTQFSAAKKSCGLAIPCAPTALRWSYGR